MSIVLADDIQCWQMLYVTAFAYGFVAVRFD